MVDFSIVKEPSNAHKQVAPPGQIQSFPDAYKEIMPLA